MARASLVFIGLVRYDGEGCGVNPVIRIFWCKTFRIIVLHLFLPGGRGFWSGQQKTRRFPCGSLSGGLCYGNYGRLSIDTIFSSLRLKQSRLLSLLGLFLSLGVR